MLYFSFVAHASLRGGTWDRLHVQCARRVRRRERGSVLILLARSYLMKQILEFSYGDRDEEGSIKMEIFQQSQGRIPQGFWVLDLKELEQNSNLNNSKANQGGEMRSGGGKKDTSRHCRIHLPRNCAGSSLPERRRRG